MAKFHGAIGLVKATVTSPGVYTNVVTEIDIKGDILRNNKRWENSESPNENINISNIFSFVGDESILWNLQYLRYLKWNDTKWKISSIEIERPRIRLTIGGVYNG